MLGPEGAQDLRLPPIDSQAKLDYILSNPKCAANFRCFARQTHVEESVDFLNAVNTFQDTVTQLARNLWSRYIDVTTASQPVNLPAGTTRKLKDKLSNPSVDMWEESKKHISRLLVSETLPKYEAFLSLEEQLVQDVTMPILSLSRDYESQKWAIKGKALIHHDDDMFGDGLWSQEDNHRIMPFKETVRATFDGKRITATISARLKEDSPEVLSPKGSSNTEQTDSTTTSPPVKSRGTSPRTNNNIVSNNDLLTGSTSSPNLRKGSRRRASVSSGSDTPSVRELVVKFREARIKELEEEEANLTKYYQEKLAELQKRRRAVTKESRVIEQELFKIGV